MKTIAINQHLLGFYFGGDADPDEAMLDKQFEENWMVDGCNALGVCCYVVHSGHEALVYDTLCTPEQMGEVKSYLQNQGITKFTVALSHWHLDHVGGTAIFENCNVISSPKTRQYLIEHKSAIESATLWGQPPIKPLILPNLIFNDSLSIFIGNVEVELHNINIHSDDGIFIYLPQFKYFLAGDMLEDTCPFVTNPLEIQTHLANLALIAKKDIQKIYPNHGRYNTIKNGGYCKELIDSVADYLNKMYQAVEQNPNCEEPDLRAFAAKYLDKGIIQYWEPYEKVHKLNFSRVKACYK